MYIVTGGAGLIGSALVWKLNQLGIENIIIVDHLGTSDKWKNLAALKYADYYEKDYFRDILQKFNPKEIQGIFHLGACSATTERDASYLIDNNFEYSKELANYAHKNNIRMIYASSCATYGDGSLGYKDDESQLHTLRPMNMYGYSKQMFDLWLKRNSMFDNIIGCKFSNVFGPNEHHKANMRSVIYLAWEQISATGVMKLFKSYKPEYKDGEQMRDFLYVKDAVDMIVFLFKHPEAKGIYNIGSGRAETWNYLVSCAFNAMDKKTNIEYTDMPEHLKDRYQYYTKTDMDKFYSLGYEKEIMSLQEAITDYIKNYLNPGKYLGDE